MEKLIDVFAIPMFAGGFLIEENIVEMTEAQFKYVEKVLYPTDEEVIDFHGFLNASFFSDPMDGVDEMVKIQRRVFKNFNKLPDAIQNVLMGSVCAQYRWFMKEHRLHVYKMPITFHEVLASLHRAMWNVAKSKVSRSSSN